MTKEERIAMIGKEKFERCTKIFSSKTTAMKRCKLLKAMQSTQCIMHQLKSFTF